jgi:hypothetical protein
MHVVEEKVGDVECRPLRAAERELFERTPPDEDPVRRSLDEGEVALHRAALYRKSCR